MNPNRYWLFNDSYQNLTERRGREFEKELERERERGKISWILLIMNALNRLYPSVYIQESVRVTVFINSVYYFFLYLVLLYVKIPPPLAHSCPNECAKSGNWANIKDLGGHKGLVLLSSIFRRQMLPFSQHLRRMFPPRDATLVWRTCSGAIAISSSWALVVAP